MEEINQLETEQVRKALLSILEDERVAKEKLIESEKRYRRLHETMTDCFVQTTMTGEIVEVNRSYLEMLGYTEEEIKKLKYQDITPAKWHEFEQNIVENQIIPRGYSDVYEKEYIRKDGTIFPVELRVYLLRDDFGNPTGMWAIVRDITERKRAEEEILQRNKEMEIIDAIIKTTTTELELQKILDTALEGAITLTGLESGALCLVNYEKKVLELYAKQNISKEMLDELSTSYIKIGDCLCGKSAETGEPLILWENASASKYATHKSVRNEGINFHASFPLVAGDKTLGVLCVFARSDFKPSERSLAMLKELCKTIALAIENARLYEEVQNNVIDLQKINAQMHALTARLQSIREEESARIAREIHDELGQALTGLKIDIKWLETKIQGKQSEIKDKLESMMKLIDSTIKTVRRISTELRPGVLELGLLPALNWQVKEFQDRTGIHCNIHQEVQDIEFTEEQSINLFRIFQEVLTNIIRHANASMVSVNLRQDNNNFIMEIQDNGKGITKEEMQNPKSLGILGMRERVSIVNGSLDIQGIPGKGTKVTVKIPL